MDGVTTYPFYVIGGDWGSAIAPVKDELPLKGDTIVGNDVWIGQHVTIMPGVHIPSYHLHFLWQRVQVRPCPKS
jgi:virginiamycin A acetyltransferase